MRTYLSAAVMLALGACTQKLKLSPDDSRSVLSKQTLMAPNPGEPGPFAVKYLIYGSGKDKLRSAFRDSVGIKTGIMDLSPYVQIMPPQVKDHDATWGFDLRHAPINGRVWYPDGPGPFPLVLVVHGNHNPTDFSDPGYRYLGELLASRGFILVSVDENFINGLSGENDGRAWALLMHFKAWKTFSDSTSNPFHGKVDWNNLGIMGHSRGGEAVGHAASFNRMSRYPDDGNIKWDFNFNIRAVVGIAPVDGQYKPAGTWEPLENVNYLVIHGSHDGDVSDFSGLRQYQRIKYTDVDKLGFKSAWYVYRANHGQWNTVWNNKDRGPRSQRSLDLRALLNPEEQRQFGRVVIGGFLEATLHGKLEYLPMFRDQRTIGQWLPKTMYITRFQESSFRTLANYEEDVDLTTGSIPGVTISADSLATWKEAPVPLRQANDEQNTNAAWLGWNNRIAGPDTSKRGRPASYTLRISDSVVTALRIGEQTSVMLSIAPTKVMPGPRRAARDSTRADTSKAARDSIAEARKKEPKPPETHDDSLPMDLSVEVVDADGHSARLPLTTFGPVRRPLETHISRRADRETFFRNPYELVLQTYTMPLTDFVKVAPSFQPSRLRIIRLVFDRTPSGTIVLDDVGVANIPPAFFPRSP